MTKPHDSRAWLRVAFLGCLIALSMICLPQVHAADLTAADEAELVAAIEAINAAGAGEHTITLTDDIILTAPLPALNNAGADFIQFDGANHTLDADGTGTALVIKSGTIAIIRNITITGGAGSSAPDGLSGGGIYNAGIVDIYDTVITGNAAQSGAGILNYSSGSKAVTLNLERVEITLNEAVDFGGAIYNHSNNNAANVVIVDSLLANNASDNYGGAISNHGAGGNATVTIENSTIAGNQSQYGGGIFNNGNSGTAAVFMHAVSMWENWAATSGGALYNNGNTGIAYAEITNTTISDNSAGQLGGGITNSPNDGLAEVELTFTTIAFNSATTGGGVMNDPGGTFTIAASILASGAGGSACATSGGAVITSSGYNLDDDGSCGLTETGDISNGNHALEPLAENPPGTTATHSIDVDSDALDQIPIGAAGCGDTVVLDQRGAPRPFPANQLCDMGAYEDGEDDEEPPPLPDCEAPYHPATEEELNAAVACVNDAGEGTHIITLAGNITLTTSVTPVDNPDAAEIVFDGDGFILNGGLSGTVLTIEPQTTAVIRDVTITGGAGTSGLFNNWAGGVYNRGDLTIENSTLISNTADRGGGIVNHADGSDASLTIVGSTLSGNSAAQFGGGIFNTSNGESNASINMVNSTLSGNAAAEGGGLFNESQGGITEAELLFVTLAGNTATSGGGGIHTHEEDDGSATVTLAATIITNGPGGSPDCAGTSGDIVSNGYNLDGDSTCNLTQATDLPGVDADLLPLALNTPGLTATHALGDDSPAIDHIPNGEIGCGTAITTDQRGAPRPLPDDGKCDIGAFEAVSDGGEEEEDDDILVFLPMISLSVRPAD